MRLTKNNLSRKAITKIRSFVETHKKLKSKYMLALESWRFLVWGEVSFCTRTLLNSKRNGAIIFFLLAQKERYAICATRHALTFLGWG